MSALGADRDFEQSHRPRIIAFYLPQFHPIPENDAWWGPGFTEWANVVRARPLFDGHDQPQLPTTMGLYDLRLPEVREAQASLARRYGIDGFCYYHYWLSGRRPFRRVMDELTRTGQPAFPFCLCWANHNWTRVWDTAEDELLWRQEYSDEDDLQHIAHLIPILRDPRYIQVQGRPLLLVYRVHDLPAPTRTFTLWRQRCTEAGLPEPYIVKFDTDGHFDDPAAVGCDASAQFLPHGIFHRVSPVHMPGARPDHLVYDYRDIVQAFTHLGPPDWRHYECVFPGWDNTPRRRDHAPLTIVSNTPELFERWLSTVYGRAGDDGIVFVNAWNEWAEGAHLEPDDRWGDAFLKAVARVTLGSPAPLELDPRREATPLQQRGFVELYQDLFQHYVRVQRDLTAFESMVERRFHRKLER
jgi:lipopolysaccharide biosynthesis protein